MMILDVDEDADASAGAGAGAGGGWPKACEHNFHMLPSHRPAQCQRGHNNFAYILPLILAQPHGNGVCPAPRTAAGSLPATMAVGHRWPRLPPLS